MLRHRHCHDWRLYSRYWRCGKSLGTVEFTGVKKTGKIPRAFWYHGNVSLTLGNYLVASLKINLYIQKRYGHPDMQNLATLKQKIWIVRF